MTSLHLPDPAATDRLGAALAATAVTFFTFLPSFVFILAGGPLVEATHGKLGFTAPLSAITAAVVGVILNLALFFAYHVLWPQGFAGQFDAPSALIAFGAAVALFGFKRGVIEVLGEPTRVRSSFVRGYSKLMVRLPG